MAVTLDRWLHKLKSPGSTAGQSDGQYILRVFFFFFSYRTEWIRVKNPRLKRLLFSIKFTHMGSLGHSPMMLLNKPGWPNILAFCLLVLHCSIKSLAMTSSMEYAFLRDSLTNRRKRNMIFACIYVSPLVYRGDIFRDVILKTWSNFIWMRIQSLTSGHWSNNVFEQRLQERCANEL